MNLSQKDGCIAAATTADKRRFWSKVKKGQGCWVWQGSAGKGYGYYWVQGATVRAHRAAKIWSLGKRKVNCFCCHRCNNTRCVRPSHIYWGSSSDNAGDTAAAGIQKMRVPRGSASKLAKINEKQAQEIVDRYFAGGVSAYTLARQFKVGRGAIDSILRGKNWKHVVVIPAGGLPNAKKGYRKGDGCAQSKLTESMVIEIRALKKSGVKGKDIAKKFQIAESNVSAICNRVTWSHVD